MRNRNGNKVETTYGAVGEIVGIDMPGSRAARYKIKLDKDWLPFKKGDIVCAFPKEIIK